MIMSDVAVTTDQHQGKYIGLIMAKSFILNVCHFYLLLNLKYLQITNYVSFVYI